MPIRGEKARKIRLLKKGKGVRPPKRLWKKLRKRVRRAKKYRGFPAKRKARITAGIWHGYKRSTKIRLVRKYQ